MRVFIIQKNEAGQRFDKYLKKRFAHAPSGFLYKMMRKKNIVLNGRRADGTEQLAAGDEVKVFFSEETFQKFAGLEQASGEYLALRELNVKLTVLYEDEDTIIINKPSGMLSQKAKPDDLSANESILAYLIQKGILTAQMMETFRPSVCNRLDRNTSGILIAGKTLKGLQQMSAALKERTVQKYYRCLVEGEVQVPMYLKGWLKKDEKENRVTVYEDEKAAGVGALPIETEYTPLKSSGGYTYLEVHLITGRSHQIRAHLAYIGHPIMGDAKYNSRRHTMHTGLKPNQTSGRESGLKRLPVHSQLLHAYRLEWAGQRTVTAPLPKEFERALQITGCTVSR